jgi:hypothetical protein
MRASPDFEVTHSARGVPTYPVSYGLRPNQARFSEENTGISLKCTGRAGKIQPGASAACGDAENFELLLARIEIV